MDEFFNPASIAVVGASQRRRGYHIIKNLLYGFKGAIYPVNPNYKVIDEIPCFPSIEAIPNPVDMAIVFVPAPAVPTVLEECARKRIFRVMIQSAGFAEVGVGGRAIQVRCKEIARKGGIRLWGPNCMGMVDVPEKKIFSFLNPRIYQDGLYPGRISLIVQSGMLAGAFLAELSRRTIGIRRVCSIGNKMDVDECDLLEYLLKDSETDVVALYLESITRGRLFAEIARRSNKPLVVLKGGRSKAGAQAALSHTASLAGNSRLLDSVLEMAGVIPANDFQEMFDLAGALSMLPDIEPRCRTAILTYSGGGGILSCDLLEKHGLPIATLSEETKKALAKIFPDWMPVANPVDLYPAMERHGWVNTYNQAISIVLNDPNVDSLLIHFATGLDEKIPDLNALKKKATESKKGVVSWLVGREKETKAFRVEALTHRIPVYDEISKAVSCLAAAARFRRRKVPAEIEFDETPQVPKGNLSKTALDTSKEGVWDEYDSKRLLARWHIPVVEENLVGMFSEARKEAQRMGFPIVLKGLPPGKVHKTELGLVHLGIRNIHELRGAYQKIQKKLGGQGRILMQRQVDIDYELIAGFLRDGQFGPCVMFGLGGIFTELQGDVVFALAPLKKSEALGLIGRIQGIRLLEGFRGMAPLNKERMAEFLMDLGNLGTAYPQIEQIDINPVAVRDGYPLALDATIILSSAGSEPE